MKRSNPLARSEFAWGWVVLLAGSMLVSPQGAAAAEYQSDWNGSRRWIGPDWWANPLTDWKVEEGAVVARAAADRTLCLLSYDLGGEGSAFEATVQVETTGGASGSKKSAAGFRIGRRGGIDDYRHALVHATHWIDAKIRADGHLVLGKSVSDQKLSLDAGPVSLKIAGQREGDSAQLILTAKQNYTEIRTAQSIPFNDIVGGLSLLSDGPGKSWRDDSEQSFAFRNFRVTGDLVRRHGDRTFGPILWSQYTLSDHQLRLQAQLAPIALRSSEAAELWIAEAEGSPQWEMVGTAEMDRLSRTVRFTVDNWSSRKAMRYEVRLKWQSESYAWEGNVRREPQAGEPLKLGCFSCDNGYLFPIPAMVSQVMRQDPDIVFFAGDQIYENYGGFGVAIGADTETAMLDYLRKFYQFGWTWRDVLRDRPSVLLPDDHDVFQGNIWGHGGRKLPKSTKENSKKKHEWGLGGYVMPGDWVAAVERTNVGHLPEPAVDMTLPIGIKPYFTSLTYGGVGFAILEDRKFKTGHLTLPEETRSEGVGADLLGSEQEAFLETWSQDWTDQRMKCALSQTIFCSAATHTGPTLKRGRYYFDSGAWPKAARNRTVRILGACNALAIHGDQHLGVLLRQGVSEFDDAGFAFMVPGTANGFPRAWWPGVNKGTPTAGAEFTGKFHDDAGHPIHVLAVGNPEPGSNLLPKSTDPMTVGYRKGSGYGMVEFDTAEETAVVSLYRLGDRDEMFPGFPKQIEVGGKP